MYNITCSINDGTRTTETTINWIVSSKETALSMCVDNMIIGYYDNLSESLQTIFRNHVMDGDLQKAFDCYNENPVEHFTITFLPDVPLIPLSDLRKHMIRVIDLKNNLGF